VPESSGNGALLAAVVAGLALIAGTVFFLARGDGKKKDEAQPERRPAEAAKTTTTPAGPSESPDPSPSAPATTTTTESTAPAVGLDTAAGKAAASLRQELEKKRLWSEVELDEDAGSLTLRSSYCEDKGLRQVIGAFKATLVAAKLKGVSCYAKYGKLIFEETF
jgi:hypothetical protein